MRFHFVKASVNAAIVAVSILLFVTGASFAQQQVNLSAGPSVLVMPDGQAVPMWAYTCGTAVTGSTATCGALNTAGGWSPVVITVPTGQDLTINLTNNLTFSGNGIPTSLTIIGQLGGGLGTTATTVAGPTHDNMGTTWPIPNSGATFSPPPQGPRVQSFSTEVAAGSTTSLTWKALKAGTYLLESGTHPSIQGPMGLYGILVVTNAPSGNTLGAAYPGVNYAAEVSLLFSEIDPVQNNAVAAAVNTAGFSESATSGPFMGGPVTSINLTNGGAGYTSAPTVNFSAGHGSGATANAVVDTDPTSPTYKQVTEVDITNGGNYTSSPQITFSGGGGTGAYAVTALQLQANAAAHCSGGAAACYPPAVNYTPLYYLINGQAFDKTNAGNSLFAAVPGTSQSPISGNVLVRMVNAGLRMHVPSIVGSQTGSQSTGGFGLIAEDGNPLPGVTRVQNEVFLAAGKTYDVMINAPSAGSSALPVFDRELSLSGNAIARDAGMLAYIGVNGSTLPAAAGLGAAVANADTYNSVVPGQTLTVADPAKGVMANDINISGVKVSAPPSHGAAVLSANGTLTYTPDATWSAPTSPTTSDSFTYCGNGALSGTACTTVTLGAAPIESASGITMNNATYTSKLAKSLKISSPGILSVDKDAAGYPLAVVASSITPSVGLTVDVDKSGGFNATVSAPGTYTFTYKAQNSQGTVSTTAATVTLIFSQGSGLQVSVLDGQTKAAITDYRWIIEEDRTFYIDPNKTTNTGTQIVPTFGTNFHTSYMPLVATGCTGPLSCESGQTVLGQSAVCDVGSGTCRTTASQQTQSDPRDVLLDPNKRYYISVLPGDAANPFEGQDVGHGMGGAPISFGQLAVTVLAQPTPFPPAKLSVFVFEDDFPLNGEQDAGGGVDSLSPNEPGLGGFNITLFDDAGGTGDATGQMTYDMFNMPLSNSLDGTIDPATGLNACPISAQAKGITGTIVTCPTYESDGKTLSPLAGAAVVANMMPGRYGVVATPGADRIGRGEEWLQTNTLDGQKAHDSFLKVGEAGYFQEFGPAGYHVSIGFANPKIINGRLGPICNGSDPNLSVANCHNTVKGMVTTERMSRTPDERLYSSGSNDSFSFTQCYVSLGDPDGEDFAFTKCAADGTFSLSNIPDGDWRVTVFDQWNDMLVDGLSTPVRVAGGLADMGQIATNQWQANIYTTTFFDANGNGVRDSNEQGLALVATNNRFRDGSYSNFNNTDLNGYAGFNEIFPLFSWYVLETESTRFKTTGVHVVYDAGGPADGTTGGGSSNIAGNLANTKETIPLPMNLRVPGAWYCATADCADAPSPLAPGGSGGSTGRVDPPYWFGTEGWQGFSGQNSFIEFGKKPYAVGETGGIFGEVIYASTRPFDDPALLIHTSWTPNVPGVTVNLYQEGTAPDGSMSLTLVDTTKTSSWDDWAQGVRSDGMPNMNCPGQGTATGTNADLFYFSLYNQPDWLDMYNNGGTPLHTLPNNSQFKCYDGMHNWNQVQPAPYDGMYQFPSVTTLDPATGKPAGTNCTICVTDPDSSDPYRYGGSAMPVPWTPARGGSPMLPAGKYVVEMVVPPGYELVKEEDKNILIGDNYIAPVTQEFAGLGNVFILPDQAEVAAYYNANNAQNATTTFGRTSLPSHEGDTGSVETFWPCVGESRIVPDYISLFPQSQEVAPFAGATRNLCDRKEVTLTDQTAALAKFWIFTSTHVAAHFTGVITDDFTSEFDPFSPQFGEKFAPPNLPISIKDWTGNEISRVYTDHWGAYNGLTYSTWEVNPPNPTGYAPQMMVTCMNDPGTGSSPDPLFNPQYSQFCYEIPFMPGQTQYMDTPVVPTSAFAGAGYNNPDCDYPDATPAIKRVDGDGNGPWVSAAGHTLTVKALGDTTVFNNAYSGPAANNAPFNQKTVTRHYGFGSTAGTVTIGGKIATVTSWNDLQLNVTVPTGVANCAMQQQAQYGGSTAQCGELVITAANGKQSIDTVTVTIGGKSPTRVTTNNPMTQSGPGSIQQAINNAMPGDLIMIDPNTYNEMLLMWKPVRLQGVGAASSIINANTQPEGKLDPWRLQVNCLFGLAPNGTPGAYDPSCGAGWAFFSPTSSNPQVDRLPLEAVVGWDATLNGNLAELLQEPTLMGAYEGAAITVLSKGVDFHGGNPYGTDTFPTGTTLLTNGNCRTSQTDPANPFPSNFQCNPSSIDGLGLTNSSQGGGGVLVHAWGHNLEIANNRIYNNTGTLSGGISVGQGEFPPAYLAFSATNAAPGSCQTALLPNTQLPYCHNLNVNIHNNSVSRNSSIGDELFSATLAGVGGVSFCTGADYYKFNYNWVCGNLGSGDGGGVGQIGFAYNGHIEHNSILFNQSTNPTISTNGGGILIMGAPDTDPVCAGGADADCPPGLVDGTGPGLVINANLVMGNAADSGSGGGIRLQGINGVDVTSFPLLSTQWYSVNVTNNIIANNVAGWDGAGVSLQDALVVNLINNTIISNDTTASAGPLFNTLGSPLASAQGTNCTLNGGASSCPQPAGLVSVQNSAPLVAAFTGLNVLCPLGHYSGSSLNGTCKSFSYPLLYNDVFWQNRSFYIGVGSLGSGTTNQQNVVALYNAFTTTQAASEASTDATTANGNGVVITGGTGACVSPASYWDIGVRGDKGPSNHASGVTLSPSFSVLTDASDYPGSNNLGSNPTVVQQYCNGSRTPPEFASMGYQVPPGIADATVPNPIFNLTPAATVDEGNNWINMSWGPLAMFHPILGTRLGDYGLAAGSPAINQIGPLNLIAYALAPSDDFYGNPRKTTADPKVDIGAVEAPTPAAPTLTSIAPNTGYRGNNVSVTLTGTHLTGTTSVNVSGLFVTVNNVTVVSDTTVTATFAIGVLAGANSRNVTVTSPGGNSNSVTFTVQAPPVPTLTLVNPNTGVKGTAVSVTLTGTNFTTNGTTFSVSGTGVSVSGITVTSSSSATATFTITSGAAPGSRNVTVTNPSGSGTLSNGFTVTGPTLTSISPTSGIRGFTVPMTLTGTNLTGATAITVSGTGVTVNSITVVNSTTVTANFVISATAATGARTVSVTTPGGTTNTVSFTVNAPTLTSISPTSHTRGGAGFTVTLTGTNLTGVTGVTVSGTLVTVTNVTAVNSTTVTATFTVASNAATGTRTVLVTNSGGATSNTVNFTVN